MLTPASSGQQQLHHLDNPPTPRGSTAPPQSTGRRTPARAETFRVLRRKCRIEERLGKKAPKHHPRTLTQSQNKAELHVSLADSMEATSAAQRTMKMRKGTWGGYVNCDSPIICHLVGCIIERGHVVVLVNSHNGYDVCFVEPCVRGRQKLGTRTAESRNRLHADGRRQQGITCGVFSFAGDIDVIARVSRRSNKNLASVV